MLLLFQINFREMVAPYWYTTEKQYSQYNLFHSQAICLIIILSY